MFKRLKQDDLSSDGSRAGKPAGEMDRLQRACARQFVDRERRTQFRPGQTAPEGRKPRALHDTLLDLDKTQFDLDKTPHVAVEVSPRAPQNDTRLDLEKTPSVAVEASPEVPAKTSLFQRLRAWFAGSAATDADRRDAPRYPFGQAHPQLRVLVGPAKWPAQVTDVSATGIGLILGMRHRLGADVQLTVQDRSRGSSYPIKAKVKRLTLQPDGTWFTCCAFDRPLDEAGLKAML